MSTTNKRTHSESNSVSDHEKSMEMTPQSHNDDITSRNINLTMKRNESLLSFNEAGHLSPIQVCVSTAASCSEISPSSSPQISPKMQPKLRGQSSPGSNTSSKDPFIEKMMELDASNCYPTNEDTISRSSESVKSVDLQKSLDSGSSKDLSKEKKGGDKKKKSTSWYNVLNPSYKSRSDDFKRIFKELPEHERLIVDYSCAIQKDILVHGRLYISQNYVCFYANIFRWETMLIIKCVEVTAMTKEKTARVIPNAIQICTESERHFFTSFGARDKTYLMLFRVWQNALMEQPMSIQELWQWVHYNYGEELGLTSDDDDYVAPSADDDAKSNGLSLLIGDGNKEFAKMAKTPTELSIDSNSFRSNCKESPAPSTLENIQSIGGSDRENNDGPEIVNNEKQLTIDSLPTSSLPSITTISEARIPTDLSDTTESDNDLQRGEVRCICDTHCGKESLNIIYPMSVEQVFTMLFCDSKFYSEFQRQRKTTDLVQSQWQESSKTGNKTRQITYTLTLGLAMGPKTAQTSETQTMLKGSKSGSVYVIEVDAVNMGIPYCDTFYTNHRYCLTRVSANECRIQVHSQIKYKKSVWGLVKNFIEKNVMQGIEEYMKELAMALQREYARFNQPNPQKARRRRRLHKPDMSKSESITDSKHIHNGTGKRMVPNRGTLEIARLVSNPEILVKIILFVLMLLLCLNALLYYKLWTLENQTNRMVMSPSLLDLDFLKNAPRTPDEWARLVQQQETLHQTEVQKWTEILQQNIALLQQTEDSLTALHHSIRPYKIQKILQLFDDQQAQAKAKQENDEL